MTHRDAAKLTRAPHNKQNRQHGADAIKAAQDFALFRPAEGKLVPEHYITGGFNIVVKTKQETVDTGETVRIFIWAESRAQAVTKALRFLPDHIRSNPEEYIVTTSSAGRVDPQTKDGVVPCLTR